MQRILVVFFTLLLAPVGLAGPDAAPVRVLFLGNSFLFGSGSPVRFFRPGTVDDLNRAGVGGVPALFKAFTVDAGLAYEVSVETASGQGFDYHLEKKTALIGRPWDVVVMQSHSVLNQAKPGDPELLIRSAKALGEFFARHNPRVDVRLIATWPRADQVYPEKGAGQGKGLEGMA
ncbi:MAG: PEP-CTERM sorting domain-containing protein, partial [Opitutaceae bacterium]